jgi:DNA replication protein
MMKLSDKTQKKILGTIVNDQNTRTTEKMPQSTTTKSMTCSEHGQYTSKKMEFKTPEKVLVHWTSCRQCQIDKEKLSEKLLRGGQQARTADQKNPPWLKPEHFHMNLNSYKCRCKAQDDILSRVKNYVKNFDKVLKIGNNVIMHGNPGTGKTHLAIAIAVELRASGFRVSYEFYRHLIFRMRETHNVSVQETEMELYNRINYLDLYILDDTGAKDLTAYEKDVLHNIVFNRHVECKPMIIITNLDLEDFKNAIRLETFDRLRDRKSALLGFNWESNRV